MGQGQTSAEPSWNGPKVVIAKPPQTQPESGELRGNFTECVWTKVIRGKKADVRALIPVVGYSSLPDCPLYSATVVDVHYKPEAGENFAFATLTIHCANNPNVIYEEVEEGLITRKIEYNPRYAGVSQAELNAIEAAIAAQSSTDFATQSARITSSLGLELFDKRLRGNDSYLEPAPIARRTTFWILVNAQRTGVRQTPVFTRTGIPPGYQWLKTADRVLTRPGFLERIEEWTGAISWDNQLYATG